MNFGEWLTIIGGFSGLISSLYVVYEKIKSGPKIIHQTRSTSLFERLPSNIDPCYQYEFLIEIDIGNTGTELTSIIRANLTLKEINQTLEINFPGDKIMDFGTKSITLEPGFAKAYQLRVLIRNEDQLPHIFNGTLNLEFIDKKMIAQDLKFSLKDKI